VYKTLIVLDQEPAEGELGFSNAMSFEHYLRDYPKKNEGKIRIINLCDTEHYLSKGYYCSLLAEARHHRILPSVKTVNALRREEDIAHELHRYKVELDELAETSGAAEFLVYFGKSTLKGLEKISSALFQVYPAPILKLEHANDAWSLECASYTDLNAEQLGEFQSAIAEFTQTTWRSSPAKKHFRWEMAILVNPDEAAPPSNKGALDRFVKAAAKFGINAHLLRIEDIPSIAQYDALFIRETTLIDHHTYRLARKAEDAGLVVMDDSDSILRCCNKIYLQDAFSYQGVPCLPAEVVSENTPEVRALLETQFDYPMVLKMPEGSFSRGVYKVKNADELKLRLDELFQDNALVLVQKYLYTEFDWRIGVLNGRALYACRYMMARDHWQIYNHGSKRFSSGDFETLPTFEVPKVVLDAALKASSVIGKGLYGVDIKEHEGKAYVIEVNDNPSIEYKVEDMYLRDELYMQIMSEFQRRLEARGL
jgi:glutathione synthase/RimK-type ligase-like ATP-grasp enzyme